MGPEAAIDAGVKLWQVGGIAAVLLAILVAGGWLMFRFFVDLVKTLGKRLNEIEDRQTKTLAAKLDESSAAMREVADSCSRSAETSREIVAALRARPCLIDSGEYHRPTLPGVHHD